MPQQTVVDGPATILALTRHLKPNEVRVLWHSSKNGVKSVDDLIAVLAKEKSQSVEQVEATLYQRHGRKMNSIEEDVDTLIQEGRIENLFWQAVCGKL